MIKKIFTKFKRNKDVPKKRKSRTRIFLTSFLVSSLVALLVGIGIFVYVFERTVIVPPEIPPLPTRPVNPNPPLPNDDYQNRAPEDTMPPWYYGLVAPERFTDDDRRDNFFTFMIIGLTERSLANTIMVASYDAVANEAYLISIPRDSLMYTNRFGRKLSSSYLAGSGGGAGRAGGIQVLQRDVMNTIGFIPDFYIIIDYDAFFAIIDAVGGVDIYVPFHFRNDDPYQNLFIDIQPGWHLMDSHTALLFARFREANDGYRAISDYDRIVNQQTIINEVVSRLLRPQNLLRLPDFVDIFNASVDTNLNVGNMLYFARELNSIRGTDALTSYTTPMLGTTGRPHWYELLNPHGIVELVNRTVNPFYRDIEVRDLRIARE